MSYTLHRMGPTWYVRDGSETLCRADVHEKGDIIYACELHGHGDPGALRMLLRAIGQLARDRDVLLHLDARNPDAWRLFRLYSRLGTVEYVSFRMNPL